MLTFRTSATISLETQCISDTRVSGHSGIQASEIIEDTARIATRLSARDPHVIDELILRYEERLRRYLIRLTSDRELADDLLQEMWMRVVTRGSQFKGDSKISTWLFAIARNLVSDLRRRRRVWIVSLDKPPEEGEELSLELLSKEITPFDRYAARERASAVNDALMTLRPEQRRLVELRFYGEMPLNEIARTTGIPLSTVKARLYRALTLVRRKCVDCPMSKPARN